MDRGIHYKGIQGKGPGEGSTKLPPGEGPRRVLPYISGPDLPVRFLEKSLKEKEKMN